MADEALLLHGEQGEPPVARARDESHVTLIKLHGSIDWIERDGRQTDWPDADFAALREPELAIHQIQKRR